MSIDIDKERADFEAHIASKSKAKHWSNPGPTERHANGDYFYAHVQLAWGAWQARAAQPAPIPAQEITLQQVADRINGRGVMSSVEFRKFLNGDGVEMYPHQLVALANLFATPLAGNALTEEAKEAARYRWLRDKSEPGICAFYLSVGQAFKGVKFARETVDEAIDAAIASHIKAGQAGKEGS